VSKDKVEHIELSSPVVCLDGIGSGYVERLGNLGIATVQDLLYHFPRDYDDRREIAAIGSVAEGDKVTVSGTVSASQRSQSPQFPCGHHSPAENDRGDPEP
jgi:ATP-dependent DNA helicase RecG